jgi:hypothetical protein
MEHSKEKLRRSGETSSGVLHSLSKAIREKRTMRDIERQYALSEFKKASQFLFETYDSETQIIKSSDDKKEIKRLVIDLGSDHLVFVDQLDISSGSYKLHLFGQSASQTNDNFTENKRYYFIIETNGLTAMNSEGYEVVKSRNDGSYYDTISELGKPDAIKSYELLSWANRLAVTPPQAVQHSESQLI